MSDPHQRRLRLTFVGPGLGGDAIPLALLTEKLQSLQQTILHAVAIADGYRGPRRGAWRDRYRRAAELTVASLHDRGITIDLDLASNPVLLDALDIGLKAIDLLFDIGLRLEAGTLPEAWPKAVARQDLDYLLRALEGLMPNAGDQYQVRLATGRAENQRVLTFGASSRARVRSFTVGESPVQSEDQVTLVGELVRIHVDAGGDKITVRAGRRNIDCAYGDSLRDQVVNLTPGSLVEVSGLATLDAGGQTERIHRLINADPVSLEPLRILSFEGGGRVFTLKAPVAVRVEYSDELWVFHHSELNLWGCGVRREDAIRDLHASFAYVYHEFAEAEPEELDAVAQRLRSRLLALVVPAAAEVRSA